MLPVINEKLEPVNFSEFMKLLERSQIFEELYTPSRKLFISTYFSERRYVKSFLGYLVREFKNKLDTIPAMGYTPKKIVLEALFLRKLHGLKLFIWILYHFLFYLMGILARRPIQNHDPYINNGSLCDLAMTLNYLVYIVRLVRNRSLTLNDVQRLNFHIKALLSNRANIVEYYSRFNKDIIIQALQGIYFEGVNDE